MEINKLSKDQIPPRLLTMKGAPKLLYASSSAPQLESLLSHKCVAIVGSRKISAYGKQVTYDLAYKLAEQGIVIVSGLALGVDGVAHRAALDAGGSTIAVLPSPLEAIYPSSHRQLAMSIVNSGGALISEYAAGTPGYRSNFVARNRIVAGLADAVLITEAAAKSGSLHTADFALQIDRDVLAVPGAITSPTSAGTNQLIKDGAALVTNVDDVLLALGLTTHAPVRNFQSSDPHEQAIITALLQGAQDSDSLLQITQLTTASFNQALTMLEIGGHIKSYGANRWVLA